MCPDDGRDRRALIVKGVTNMIDERTRRSRAWQLAVPAAALAFAAGQSSAQEPTARRARGPSRVNHRHGLANRHARCGDIESRDIGRRRGDQNSGVTNVTDYLKTVPALVGSTDKNDAAGSNTFIGGTGLTLLNLRNLGVDRTLVLVNGRRHVAGLPGSAAVDVDTIPFALLERVDIQTGGASALYGADGVSGVVNFILRRDYEGFDVRAQYGSSEEGDADTVLVSGVLGQNVDDGRGNVTVALEYSKEKRLRANQRDFAGGGNRSTFQENPADLDDDPAVPDEIPLRDVRFWDSGPAGAVDADLRLSSRISTATTRRGTSVTCRFRPGRADSAVLPAGRRRLAEGPVHRRPHAGRGSLHVQCALHLRDHAGGASLCRPEVLEDRGVHRVPAILRLLPVPRARLRVHAAEHRRRGGCRRRQLAAGVP